MKGYHMRSAVICLVFVASLCCCSEVLAMTASSRNNRIIDSHLHVWANRREASNSFPFAPGQDPPDSLQDRASIDALIEEMDRSGVHGAVIVQPINHKFDHSYVIHAIKSHPHRFKGMLLFDPSHSPEKAIHVLKELASKGFVGVRFNPYLWPKSSEEIGWMPMSSSDAAIAVYQKCAELNMAVGVMCFHGLQLHFDDILKLIHSSPQTNLIIDHFGFCSFSEQGNRAFEQLLSLSTHPQVSIKVSALFRLNDTFPFTRVQKERLVPLLEAFGANRLLFGTDFPFVLLEPNGYGETVHLVSSWIPNEQDRTAVLGGNAEKLFGKWA